MAIDHWREPDRGIWEVRGEPKHFTSSKMLCWVACDRGARLAELREDRERAERWQAAADEIHADICEHGVDERGVFTQHYDTDALDASLLLMPLLRFLPPDDPRLRATVLADRRRADRGRPGAALPHRGDRRRPAPARRAPSLICSFWLVSALVEIGELDRARELCEKSARFACPLDLYAEEIDPQHGPAPRATSRRPSPTWR